MFRRRDKPKPATHVHPQGASHVQSANQHQASSTVPRQSSTGAAPRPPAKPDALQLLQQAHKCIQILKTINAADLRAFPLLNEGHRIVQQLKDIIKALPDVDKEVWGYQLTEIEDELKTLTEQVVASASARVAPQPNLAGRAHSLATPATSRGSGSGSPYTIRPQANLQGQPKGMVSQQPRYPNSFNATSSPSVLAMRPAFAGTAQPQQHQLQRTLNPPQQTAASTHANSQPPPQMLHTQAVGAPPNSDVQAVLWQTAGPTTPASTTSLLRTVANSRFSAAPEADDLFSGLEVAQPSATSSERPMPFYRVNLTVPTQSEALHQDTTGASVTVLQQQYAGAVTQPPSPSQVPVPTQSTSFTSGMQRNWASSNSILANIPMQVVQPSRKADFPPSSLAGTPQAAYGSMPQVLSDVGGYGGDLPVPQLQTAASTASFTSSMAEGEYAASVASADYSGIRRKKVTRMKVGYAKDEELATQQQNARQLSLPSTPASVSAQHSRQPSYSGSAISSTPPAIPNQHMGPPPVHTHVSSSISASFPQPYQNRLFQQLGASIQHSQQLLLTAKSQPAVQQANTDECQQHVPLTPIHQLGDRMNEQPAQPQQHLQQKDQHITPAAGQLGPAVAQTVGTWPPAPHDQTMSATSAESQAKRTPLQPVAASGLAPAALQQAQGVQQQLQSTAAAVLRNQQTAMSTIYTSEQHQRLDYLHPAPAHNSMPQALFPPDTLNTVHQKSQDNWSSLQPTGNNSHAAMQAAMVVHTGPSVTLQVATSTTAQRQPTCLGDLQVFLAGLSGPVEVCQQAAEAHAQELVMLLQQLLSSNKDQEKAVAVQRLAIQKDLAAIATRVQQLEQQQVAAAEVEDFDTAAVVDEQLIPLANQRMQLEARSQQLEVQATALVAERQDLASTQARVCELVSQYLQKLEASQRQLAQALDLQAAREADEAAKQQQEEELRRDQLLQELAERKQRLAEHKTDIELSVSEAVAPAQQELDKLRQQHQELQAEVDSLRAQLAAKERQLQDSQVQLRHMEAGIAATTSLFDAPLAQLQAQQQEVQTQQQALEEQAGELERRRLQQATRAAQQQHQCTQLHQHAEQLASAAAALLAQAAGIQNRLLADEKAKQHRAQLKDLVEAEQSNFQALHRLVSELQRESMALASRRHKLAADRAEAEERAAAAQRALPELESQKKTAATNKDFKEAARLSAAAKAMVLQAESLAEVSSHLRAELLEVLNSEAAKAEELRRLQNQLEEAERAAAHARYRYVSCSLDQVVSSLEVAVAAEDYEQAEALNTELVGLSSEVKQLEKGWGFSLTPSVQASSTSGSRISIDKPFSCSKQDGMLQQPPAEPPRCGQKPDTPGDNGEQSETQVEPQDTDSNFTREGDQHATQTSPKSSLPTDVTDDVGTTTPVETADASAADETAMNILSEPDGSASAALQKQ